MCLSSGCFCKSEFDYFELYILFIVICWHILNLSWTLVRLFDFLNFITFRSIIEFICLWQQNSLISAFVFIFFSDVQVPPSLYHFGFLTFPLLPVQHLCYETESPTPLYRPLPESWIKILNQRHNRKFDVRQIHIIWKRESAVGSMWASEFPQFYGPTWPTPTSRHPPVSCLLLFIYLFFFERSVSTEALQSRCSAVLVWALITCGSPADAVLLPHCHNNTSDGYGETGRGGSSRGAEFS